MSTMLILADTFMVEDAVEAIGFGTFQWKLSVLTGLSWVRTALYCPLYTVDVYVSECIVTFVSVWSDGRRYGDDDPQHLSPSAPLWMEAAQPGGGTAHVGNGSLMSTKCSSLLCCINVRIAIDYVFSDCLRKKACITHWENKRGSTVCDNVYLSTSIWMTSKSRSGLN